MVFFCIIFEINFKLDSDRTILYFIDYFLLRRVIHCYFRLRMKIFQMIFPANNSKSITTGPHSKLFNSERYVCVRVALARAHFHVIGEKKPCVSIQKIRFESCSMCRNWHNNQWQKKRSYFGISFAFKLVSKIDLDWILSRLMLSENEEMKDRAWIITIPRLKLTKEHYSSSFFLGMDFKMGDLRSNNDFDYRNRSHCIFHGRIIRSHLHTVFSPSVKCYEKCLFMFDFLSSPKLLFWSNIWRK